MRIWYVYRIQMQRSVMTWLVHVAGCRRLEWHAEGLRLAAAVCNIAVTEGPGRQLPTEYRLQRNMPIPSADWPTVGPPDLAN